MSCKGCRQQAQQDNILAMAGTELKLDKTDYIIYEQEDEKGGTKRYYGKLDCWKKDGKPGRATILLFYIR